MTPEASAPALTARLLSRLANFLDRVRREGVVVGTGSSLDFGEALEVLPVLQRQAVRDASRVTLAKSPEDVRRVERVFDLFWDPYENAFFETPTTDQGSLPRNLGPKPYGREPPPVRRRRSEIDREKELPIGVYSAEAPSPGHPLEALPDRALARMRTNSRRFRRECATLPGRRTWARPRGDLDLPATARRAARTAGEWVELAHRAPRMSRTDLVVLWDVSGSMREHDAVLFALVYSLKRLVRSTRVFAFSTETVELTPYLSGVPYRRALNELTAHLEAPGGGTQIAACLREFRHRWGSSIRATTTIVVMSDGWDLGDPEGLAFELGALRRSAYRLIWVNPYSARPGFSPMTAGMRAALPFVDRLTSPEQFPAPSRSAVRMGAGTPRASEKRISTPANHEGDPERGIEPR